MTNRGLAGSEARHLADLEERLIRLFADVPTIQNLRRAATRRYSYVPEVQFNIGGSDSTFYFLLYSDGWLLGKAEDSIGLPASKEDGLPKLVIDYLNERFPWAEYVHSDHPVIDNSHLWHKITEEQLPLLND